MKAIVVGEFGGASVLKLQETPDPEPGEGEVLIRTGAAGVNPVETYIRSGTHALKPDLPYTPGTDAGGTVEAVGTGVTDLDVGERVYTAGTLSGAYAELILCHRDQVHILPESVSFNQGAAINIPYATAFRGLHQRGEAKPGETLLIHGASGAVGSAAAQMGVAHGMTVIGTVGTERGAEMVRNQGVEHVFDHNSEGYLEQIREATHGNGVNLILEMLSNVNLAKDLSIVSQKGRIVVIGCRGTIEINPREAMMREADIRGLVLFGASPEEIASIHSGIGAGLRNGTLSPIVGKEMALSEAAAAHEVVLEAGAYGKIVLAP